MSIQTPSDGAAASATSTKPYMLRAIYEWCTDNGFTPYLAVFVNSQVVVPMQHVKNNEIVLNVSFDATQGLKLDNDAVSFVARFGGVARDIYVPIDNVVAIYARENGQGMAFTLSPELQKQQVQGVPDSGKAAGEPAAEQSSPAAAPAASAPNVVSLSVVPSPALSAAPAAEVPEPPEPPPANPPPAGSRPALKRVK
jgi:stringent starvation protein B